FFKLEVGKKMLHNAHSLPIKEVVELMGTDPDKGLSDAEVLKRRSLFGKNRLQKTRPKSIARIFLEQFLDPIIYLLGAAMVLAFVFGEWVEGYAVLVVILITTGIGFFMEWQAIRSVEALQKMAQTTARVVRDGNLKTVQGQDLVPGDVVQVKAGDVIPADARVIHSNNMSVTEAMLSGESNSIDKKTEKLPEDIQQTEQNNMVFKGTGVTRGSGTLVVTATGDATVIGKISTLTRGAVKEIHPLEERLKQLTHKLIWLTLILSVIIAVSGYLQGKDLMLMIKTGVALAVAAIPEGLPVVATIALARGMVRLSKQKVIIKKLEAVQTLGETGILCTDKTGTLTENKMVLHTLLFPHREYKRQAFETSGFMEESPINRRLVEIGVLCNNLSEKKEDRSGDAIETALLDFADTLGVDILNMREEYPRLQEIPFDSESKRMTTLHKTDNEYLVCVKGAVERLLESSDTILTDAGEHPFTDKKAWYAKADRLAADGLRILAFAYRETKEKPSDLQACPLVFVGIVGFMDPPREDVKEAIQTYKDAGIRVVMITGDHPETARKIAEEIGLLEPGYPPDALMHGKVLKDLKTGTAADEKKILYATVFARMVPAQKLDLIGFYQKHNAVVGMLGDGVNDAPALKKADIGIAMGIRGTEAAKEVSDVILMDDKFTSTELAIRQGRTIFGNIRQFVVYLMSCNLAEILAVAIASLAMLPMPLFPLQILFINLVTDIFPALALGMGKGARDTMKQAPRRADEPIITPLLWRTTIAYSLCLTAGVIGITLYADRVLQTPEGVANTMAFFTLVLAQLLHVFNLPKRQLSFLQNEVTKNKWVWFALLLSAGIMAVVYLVPMLRDVLSIHLLTPVQFLTIGAFAVATLIATQIIKRLGLVN
ncbi:MAG: cation-transporting P-type ATPase, partial [Flavobacteriaceae bacterium]